jgi:hypothetical protein
MAEKPDLIDPDGADPKLSQWITAPISEDMNDRVTRLRTKMGISRAELARRALNMYLRKQETR